MGELGRPVQKLKLNMKMDLTYNNYRMVENENARVGCLPGIGILQQGRPRSKRRKL
jgi:hypothetical protein